jgi:hypothetical protein
MSATYDDPRTQFDDAKVTYAGSRADTPIRDIVSRKALPKFPFRPKPYNR